MFKIKLIHGQKSHFPEKRLMFIFPGSKGKTSTHTAVNLLAVVWASQQKQTNISLLEEVKSASTMKKNLVTRPVYPPYDHIKSSQVLLLSEV